MNRNFLVKYPRRSNLRSILKGLAKFSIHLLLDVKINGLENLLPKGPYIVIGNHVSALEPLLMLMIIPHQLEYLGTGDIPIDPRMSLFTKLYGFIPIMRGQIDQSGLNAALSILDQKGVLGIFPEGGIWEKNLKEPKMGTSWIAYKSKATIIPIGFIGMNGALKKALSLKRPTVRINIGKPISNESLFHNETSIKSMMVNSSNLLMDKLAELLPSEEINNPDQHKTKNLKFFGKRKASDTLIEIKFINQEDFQELIEHPVIMDVLKRNLKLPIKPLKSRNKFEEIENVLNSLYQITSYLEKNPGFLSYRFGIDKAINMKNGISTLVNILENQFNSKDEFSIDVHQE